MVIILCCSFLARLGARCSHQTRGGDQGDSFRENRPPGPPAKAFDYFQLLFLDLKKTALG